MFTKWRSSDLAVEATSSRFQRTNAHGEIRSQHVFTHNGCVASIARNYVMFYFWPWGPVKKGLIVVIKKNYALIKDN